MPAEKNAFDVSLKAAVSKLGLPGQQRDVVQWLLLRFCSEVCVIAVLNHVPLQRSKMLKDRQAELLQELADLASTEHVPAAPPSTLSPSPAGPATA